MEELIKKIYQVLDDNQSVFTAAQLSPVKTIDLYKGQPINPEIFEFFETPALFLNHNITWSLVGKTYQGELTIEAHLLIDSPFEGTANIFTNHEEALRRNFYHKLVRKILDGIETNETTKLIRVSERPVDTGVVVYHILEYRCQIFNYDVLGDDSILIDDAVVNITGKKIVKQIT